MTRVHVIKQKDSARRLLSEYIRFHRIRISHLVGIVAIAALVTAAMTTEDSVPPPPGGGLWPGQDWSGNSAQPRPLIGQCSPLHPRVSGFDLNYRWWFQHERENPDRWEITAMVYLSEPEETLTVVTNSLLDGGYELKAYQGNWQIFSDPNSGNDQDICVRVDPVRDAIPGLVVQSFITLDVPVDNPQVEFARSPECLREDASNRDAFRSRTILWDQPELSGQRCEVG